MSDMSEYEPPTGHIDTLAGAGGNGITPVDVTMNGYDDEDLDAAESYDYEDDGSEGADDDVAVLHARTEALEDLHRQQDASRVRRKVSTATLGGGVAGAVPAILEATDAMSLSTNAQSLVIVIAAIIGAF